MTTMTVSQARADLYNLVNDANSNHEPIHITSKHGNAVLIGEEDWEAIRETIYLASIPGMAESIKEGMATPSSECDEDIDW